jgi:hypothetical protein
MENRQSEKDNIQSREAFFDMLIKQQMPEATVGARTRHEQGKAGNIGYEESEKRYETGVAEPSLEEMQAYSRILSPEVS